MLSKTLPQQDVLLKSGLNSRRDSNLLSGPAGRDLGRPIRVLFGVLQGEQPLAVRIGLGRPARNRPWLEDGHHAHAEARNEPASFFNREIADY